MTTTGVWGNQAYAYNSKAEVLAVVCIRWRKNPLKMPNKSGFSTRSQRRGYRIALEDGETVTSVQMTQDEDPLLLLAVSVLFRFANRSPAG